MVVNGKTVFFSASTAKQVIVDGPAEAKRRHYLIGDGVREEKGASLRKGILIDRLTFGVGPRIEVLDFPDWRTKKARETRKEVESHYAIACLPQELNVAAKVALGVTTYLGDKGFALNPIYAQKKIVWQSDDGVDCKAIMDFHEPGSGLVIDLKSIFKLSEDEMKKQAWKYRYDIQAGCYREAVDQDPILSVGGVTQVVFLFVDANTGECKELTVNENAMAVGDHEWRRARRIWSRCIATDNWPETIEEAEENYVSAERAN